MDDGGEARAAVGRMEEKTRSSDRKGGVVGPKTGTFNQLPTRLKQRGRYSQELGGKGDEEEKRAQGRSVRRIRDAGSKMDASAARMHGRWREPKRRIFQDNEHILQSDEARRGSWSGDVSCDPAWVK